MIVAGVSLRDFRCYERAQLSLADGLTVITGPNGSGKTNSLEGIYFGCTGRSCRTANEREVVRFGAGTTRVVVNTIDEDGAHELSVGLTPGEPKRMRVDGARVERLLDVPGRPLVSVFLPDRLELIKGVPTLRRAHLDQFVAALWPTRSGTRRAYAQALAQRNALLGRIGAGYAPRATIDGWNLQLARHGIALMADRAAAVEGATAAFERCAAELGLDGEVSIEYRPRSGAQSAQQLAEELAERLDGDLERGFTGHGPHRDDLIVKREGRELRAYGSQGQQRLALLALLLAERETIAISRHAPPLLLLDDVMSELDHSRRERLIRLLRDSGGQSIITTTDLEHVPGADEPGVARVAVQSGRLLTEIAA